MCTGRARRHCVGHPITERDPHGQPMTTRLVTLAHAAEALDVHPRAVRRDIAAGRLTGYRVGPHLTGSTSPRWSITSTPPHRCGDAGHVVGDVGRRGQRHARPPA